MILSEKRKAIRNFNICQSKVRKSNYFNILEGYSWEVWSLINCFYQQYCVYSTRGVFIPQGVYLWHKGYIMLQRGALYYVTKGVIVAQKECLWHKGCIYSWRDVFMSQKVLLKGWHSNLEHHMFQKSFFLDAKLRRLWHKIVFLSINGIKWDWAQNCNERSSDDMVTRGQPKNIINIVLMISIRLCIILIIKYYDKNNLCLCSWHHFDHNLVPYPRP